MDESFNFLEAVKNRNTDGLRKLTQEELNAQTNESFMSLNLEDVKWMGEQFTINLNFSELATMMKPDVLDYLLKQGLRFPAYDVDSMFLLHPENIAVFLKNGVEIPGEVVCGWAFMDGDEKLEIYLKNGGSPAICDEEGKSLIECWYTQNGNCEMVELLKSRGCSLPEDAQTMDEKIAWMSTEGVAIVEKLNKLPKEELDELIKKTNKEN